MKRELKVHLTSSPHLQFFKIIHCNLNGTKAAVEGWMLFLFSGFFRELLLQGRSEPSLRIVTKLSDYGGRKSSHFERVTFTK